MSLYDKIFPPRTITLENGKTVQQPVSRMPLIIVLVLICCAVSVKVTGFNFATLAKRGEQFFVILGDMFPPNWKYSSQVWGPLFDTIKMSLLGSFIGTVAAIPFAVLASTNEDKITFLAVCGKEAVAQGVKAGDLVKSVCAICGGKGGGKPDSAMGGGKDMLKLDDALASVDDFVAVKLGL